jgi:4-hydroxythreonine-4-phosphate dehydrogenase
MLAELSGVKKVAMMLSSPEMNVVVLTTHLPLKNAVMKVKKELVLEKILLIRDFLRPDKPIGVCGLNPHASDGGLFGDEEKLEISPAVRQAQRMKIDVKGPFPADTIFAPRIRRQYGAILAMYHDQGLGPIKATGFGNCANITLGLPFIRTSVDHGTALEIAGKGTADPSSMIYAVKTAFRIYSRL